MVLAFLENVGHFPFGRLQIIHKSLDSLAGFAKRWTIVVIADGLKLVHIFGRWGMVPIDRLSLNLQIQHLPCFLGLKVDQLEVTFCDSLVIVHWINYRRPVVFLHHQKDMAVVNHLHQPFRLMHKCQVKAWVNN